MSETEGSFAEFAARECKRLTAVRENIRGEQEALLRKMDEIDREFAAIEAYEAAKTGKPTTQNPVRTPRVKRGSRREDVLNLVRSSDGLSRGEILERFGLKGDKAGEMSVSNALTVLTKRGELVRENGKYRVPLAREAMREAAE